MFHQICCTLCDEVNVFFQVLFAEGFARTNWRSSSVHFQCTHRSHNDSTLWFKSRRTAFNVEELFHTNISTETSFRDNKSILSNKFEGNFVSNNRRVTSGNIGERSSMNQNWSTLHGLHQGRHKSILHQHSQSSTTSQIVCRDRNAFQGVSNNHCSQFFTKVGQIFRQSKNSHNFRCYGDVKPSFTTVLNTRCTLFFRFDSFLRSNTYINFPQVSIASI
mmetsp:Transcript_16680/g.23510  ORF Transcript_16680/g.23510 Transcript_16680/m.23510 type:complete len:219 (-) Transcript_16680:862-1518(-)